MLRHVIEKQHPAVGILSIREAIRSNHRVQELDALASTLLARGEWTPYERGTRPAFTEPPLPEVDMEAEPAEPRHVERERARHSGSH
jgi:hypothetical protein